MNFIPISGLTAKFHKYLHSKMQVLHMFKTLVPLYQSLCKFWVCFGLVLFLSVCLFVFLIRAINQQHKTNVNSIPNVNSIFSSKNKQSTELTFL